MYKWKDSGRILDLIDIYTSFAQGVYLLCSKDISPWAR